MSEQRELDEAMRRTLEAGPADPMVVALEQRLHAAVESAAPQPEVVAIKAQLLERYFPAILERSGRLDRERFKTDVFFESYLRRLISLAEELGYQGLPQVAVVQLLLAGLHQARGDGQTARALLAALRQRIESGEVDLSGLGGEVVECMTQGINAIVRPVPPMPPLNPLPTGGFPPRN